MPPVAEPEPAPAEPLAATAEEVADSTFLQPVTDSPPKPAPPDIVAEPGAAPESSVGTASPAEEPVDAATYRGCRGVVLDGPTRDSLAIKEMGFPVFHVGFHPADSMGRLDVVA